MYKFHIYLIDKSGKPGGGREKEKRVGEQDKVLVFPTSIVIHRNPEEEEEEVDWEGARQQELAIPDLFFTRSESYPC